MYINTCRYFSNVNKRDARFGAKLSSIAQQDLINFYPIVKGLTVIALKREKVSKTAVTPDVAWNALTTRFPQFEFRSINSPHRSPGGVVPTFVIAQLPPRNSFRKAIIGGPVKEATEEYKK